MYQSRAVGLDLSTGRVLCADRPAVAFDTVCFDIGSTPALAMTKGHDDALAVKPVHACLDQWHRVEPDLLALDQEVELVIVGGGTGGVGGVMHGTGLGHSTFCERGCLGGRLKTGAEGRA